MRYFIICLIVFAMLLPVFSQESKIEIWAHYCAWFKIDNGYWDQKTNTTPKRGLYNSSDPNVAAQQNKEKNDYGIGVDIVSWCEEHEQFLFTGYFNAYNYHTRKFGILYEILPLLGERECYDFSDPILAEKFLYHIDYLVDMFGWRPECLKVDDRPVVYIWTGNFKNFKKVSELARQKVYLVVSMPILFPPNDDDKEKIEILNCFDAVTDYGICPTYLAGKYNYLNADAIKEYIKAIVRWDRIIKLYAPDVELILPVQFAYHDNRGDVDPNTRKNRILNSTAEQAELFAKAARFLVDKLKIKRIFIVSYNEHFEGTGIEENEEWGSLWLSLIKKYFVDESVDPEDEELKKIRNRY